MYGCYKSRKNLLLGFTACNRFDGKSWFDEKQIQVVLNLEGIEIPPCQTVVLESFFAGYGKKSELEERYEFIWKDIVQKR